MPEPPPDLTSSRPPLAIVCRGADRTGVLYEMSSVIVRHGGYIHSVDILERGARSAIFWELYGVDDEEALIADMEALDGVDHVQRLHVGDQGVLVVDAVQLPEDGAALAAFEDVHGVDVAAVADDDARHLVQHASRFRTGRRSARPQPAP